MPCGAISNYKIATGWRNFVNFVENSATLTVIENDKSMGFATVTKLNSCDDPMAEVQAQALSGYKFIRWSDGSTDNPHIVLVEEDMTLSAEFAPEEVDVENVQIISAELYTREGILYVEGAGTDYSVLNTAGHLFYSGNDNELQLPRGVYMVNVDGKIQKVVI